MKKFLLIVFMLMLAVPVNGLENNSIKYKYYRFNKVMGPLVFKGEANEEFPLVDEENPIKTELSELLTDKPEEKNGREIYEYEGYHYLKIPLIDSIEIEVLPTFSISNINITSINGDIEVSSDNDKSLANGEKGNFWLSKSTDLKDLIISVKTGTEGDYHNFNVYFKSNNRIVSKLCISMRPNANGYIYGTQSVIDTSSLEDIYFTEEQNNQDLIYKGRVTLYQFFDYQYQSYKLEKEYYPEYLSEPFEDYIYKDESDYIIEGNDIEDDIDVDVEDNIDVDIEDEQISNLENDYINISETDDPMEIKSLVEKAENKIKSLDEKIPETNTKTETPKTNVNKPKQYQSVVKASSGQTVSNQVSNNKTYFYFILVILIILLLIMLKIRKKLKTSYR